jgi:hypothetical protein
LSRRPRDPNQLAKLIVELATGEASEAKTPAELEGKNPPPLPWDVWAA